MILNRWGPWIDAPGLESGIFSLDGSDQDGIGAVGVLVQCGWFWRKDRQMILFNQSHTLFRTIEIEKLFVADDYRRPLARILENNHDLLDEVQIQILKSKVW